MLERFRRLSDTLAVVSAWLFFAVGAMIVYEVVARYIFTAPTIWAEEMSRFFQLWAVYIAAAAVLKSGDMIRITIVTERLPAAWKRLAEALQYVVIAGFSVVAIWYGIAIVADSVALDRNTSTMLSVPQWMTEIVIPVGFALLLVECLAKLAALAANAEAEQD